MKSLVGSSPFAILAFLGFFACTAPQDAHADDSRIVAPLLFGATDRILILAPHPDDEVLGAGGVLQRAVKLNLPVRVVFLTNGDFNAWSYTVYRKRPILTAKGMLALGKLRQQEAVAASKVLGVSKENLVFLGYPDHGTLAIWLYRWGNAPPFKGGWTNAGSVPYKDAYHFQAPYKGEEILNDLRSILREFQPTKVFVTNPADENPDHRAAYLFLRVALWDLEDELSPEILPFLIHYRFRHWPVPQGYHPDEDLVMPPIFAKAMTWKEMDLTKDEIGGKYFAIHQHKTQFEYSGKYLSSFVRTNEMFGDFPTYHIHASSATDLGEGELFAESELPEEFTPEEKDAYVYIEKRRASIEDGQIVLSTRFKNPLKEKTRLSIYLFGYRADTPFGNMPKIRLEVGRFSHKFFDGSKRLMTPNIQFVQKEKQITIKVPRSVLGDPSLILTGVQASLEEFPLDCMAWRAVAVTSKNQNEGSAP